MKTFMILKSLPLRSRQIFPAIVIGSTLALAAGCAADTGADESEEDGSEVANTRVVTEKDNGKTLQVKKGTSVRLELPGNASTGYEWVVTSVSKSLGSPRVTYKRLNSGLGAGESGLYQFTWKTDGAFPPAGSVNGIALEYKRSWEKSALKKFNFEIAILPAKPAAIWTQDATRAVLNTHGGFMPPAPKGSTCSWGSTFTVDTASRKVSWEVCNFGGSPNSPLTLKKGSVVLSVSDFSKIDVALSKVAISTRDFCGADAPTTTLAVTTPAGTKSYQDDFYACDKGSVTYVSGLGDVSAELRKYLPLM